MTLKDYMEMVRRAVVERNREFLNQNKRFEKQTYICGLLAVGRRIYSEKTMSKVFSAAEF
jgi:hypothetical protein